MQKCYKKTFLIIIMIFLYIFVEYIVSCIIVKNQKLLTLIINDTEAPLYKKNNISCSVYPPIQVKYGLWWIIKCIECNGKEICQVKKRVISPLWLGGS